MSFGSCGVMRRPAKICKRRLALWTLTIRDSFVVLLPLTFMGVTVTLLANAPFPAMRQLLIAVLGTGWRGILDSVLHASYGVFGRGQADHQALQHRVAPQRGHHRPLPDHHP